MHLSDNKGLSFVLVIRSAIWHFSVFFYCYCNLCTITYNLLERYVEQPSNAFLGIVLSKTAVIHYKMFVRVGININNIYVVT